MSLLYQHPDYRSLYAACLADYGEATGWAVLRDWLRDRGVPEEVVGEAEPLIALRPRDVLSFGSGIGSGRGSGIGSGFGSGFGSGSGSGRGRGSGSGFGSGSGSGRGRGSGINGYEVRQMDPGKAYLIHCGDWHTFVGRCLRQTGPMTYVFESVSKVCETNNGDCWDKLAAGDERLRAACTYAHFTTECPIPLSIFATVWEGDTPQESLAKKQGR